MSDTTQDDKQTSRPRRPGGPSRGSQGTVRQSFSHGRSNQVVVETKKRRFNKPGDAPGSATRPAAVRPGSAPRPSGSRPGAQGSGASQTSASKAAAAGSGAAPSEARMAALAAAKAAEATEAKARAARETAARVEAEKAAAREQAERSAAESVAKESPARTAPPAGAVSSPTSSTPASATATNGVAATASAASTEGSEQSATRGAARTASSNTATTARGQQVRSNPSGASSATAGAAVRGAPRAESGARSGTRPGAQRAGTGAQRGGARPAAARGGAGGAVKQLSASEIDARRRALALAKSREGEEQARAKAEEERRIREAEERRRDREEQARREKEDAERRAREAEEKRVADEARERRERAAAARGGGRNAPAMPDIAAQEAEEARGAKGPGRGNSRGPAARPDQNKPGRSRPGGDRERRRGKLTLSNALDDTGRARSLAAARRRQEKMRRGSGPAQPREKVSREVTVPETIIVSDLANRMSERSVDIIKFMMAQDGAMLKPGDVLDADTAQLIAEEFGHTVKRVSEADVEEGLFDETPDSDEDLRPRAPVVTIMGHVDHGKTSLLDAIRNAKVASGEAGGITQHIGAYQVERNGQAITFLDTPGHAAFTAMRARGAEVTDIAVLVVAADDSVMPQTIESINHAKAAGVPMIVAINKIDKPDADPNKIRTDLLQHEVIVEQMSGDVQDVEVSALKGTGLDDLLDAILLQSELLELQANPDRAAEGTVIEAQLDKGRGSVATVLVQKGTLKRGDIVVAGDEWGKVRALIDYKGKQLKTGAGPSTPVEVLGLQGTPGAGDRLAVVDSEARAREITDYRQRVARDKVAAAQAGTAGSLEQMMMNLQTKQLSEAPLVIKGDVQGSVEAIVSALVGLGTDEVAVRVVHAGAGGITESDVSLAEATGAPIIGFNVRANAQAKRAAEQAGIEIRYYNVIYDLLDDVKGTLSGMLAPERRETFIGNAEILEIFNISKVGKIAGCRVTEGKVERGSGVRLIRDDVVIHEGTLKTLKRFKDEVETVNGGQECGMAFERYEDMRVGDVIECFRVEMIERSL